MSVVNKNLKIASIINSIFIVIAILIRIVFFNYEDGILVFIDSSFSIATLVIGLIYAISGYKKNASTFYKTFMGMYLFSCVLSLATLVQYFINNNSLLSVNSILVILCLVISIFASFKLGFSLDLGYNKSRVFALMIMLSNLIKLVGDLIFKLPMSLPIDFSNFVFACILLVFVLGKYIEKDNRGTK